MNRIINKIEKKDIYTIGYVAITVLCLLILLFNIILSHGELISHYFFYDTADTGMDFFHSIEYVNGRAPYDLFNTLYPPLANLFFYIVFYCIPMSVSNNWPMDFKESVLMRRTEYDLRVYQAPMLVFIMFIILSIVVTICIALSVLEKYDITIRKSVIFCIVFSYGFLMAAERGNIVLIVIPLTMFFVFFYDSDNKIIRELSYVLLAMAAGLKLYPAFFGLLLIKDKKWGAAIRTVIYGVLSIILPVIFFKERLAGIITWLKVVFDFNKESMQPWIGNGCSNLLHDYQHFMGLFNLTVSDSYFGIISIIIVCLLLIIALFENKRWKSILLITLAVCLFQSQGEYIFSFFVIPMIAFLVEQQEFEGKYILPYICMVLLNAPIPVFYIKDELYPRNTIIHAIYTALIIWGIIDIIYQLKHTNKGIRQRGENKNEQLGKSATD